jgi:hypothetical protein
VNIVEHKISQTFDKILSNKNFINEVLIDVESSESKYPNLIFHGRTKKDKLPKALLDDLQKAAEVNNFKITIDWAKTGHRKHTASGNVSRHWRQGAVDIDFIILPDGKKVVVDPKNREVVEKFTNTLSNMGYKKNSEGKSNPKAFLTFGFENHDDHVHVSNMTDESFKGEVVPGSSETPNYSTDVATTSSTPSSSNIGWTGNLFYDYMKGIANPV